MVVYDLVVLGGGSGGSACARRAADYGQKVMIIDKGPTRDAKGNRTGAGFGGTCVNVGCVPKKIMYFAASQRESMVGHVATAAGFGISVPEGAGSVDWPALKARRDKYVASLNVSYENNWKKAGIEVVMGEASLVSADTVRVIDRDGERQVKAKKILVAVGGVPSSPSIPGSELAIDSDGFFDLEKQPKKVAVIGAGYIAVEMAGIFHGLGSETHLFFRGSTVLRHGFDPYIVETLMDELKTHGPALHANSTPARLERAADGTKTLVVQDAAGKEVAHKGFDCVLMATGRKPSTRGLGLEMAGTAPSPFYPVAHAHAGTRAGARPSAHALATASDESVRHAPCMARGVCSHVPLCEPHGRCEDEQIGLHRSG